MAKRFVSVDRETPLLMPPSIQEWLAEDDMARFVVDAVEVVDEAACKINWRGTGSAQYPPQMMLALLIYSYANGIFSSRRIERSTYRDVAVRFITGDTHPDHDTIASFRRNNAELFKECFAKVLAMARSMKVGRVGEIAIDGSKLEANASKKRVLDKERLHRGIGDLECKVEELLARAAQVDESDAQGGDGSSLPAELAQASKRLEAMRTAMKQLEQKSEQRHIERNDERDKFDRNGPGDPPRKLAKEPRPKDTIHTSDPDARLMPMKKGGYAPGYNVQLAVAADPQAPLIIATGVNEQTSDRRQLEPMVERVMAARPDTTRVHVDCGYDNSAQVYQVEKNHQVVVYCPPEISKPYKKGVRQSAARKATIQYRQAMRSCMQSEKGRLSQRLRATSVEPVFGWIKEALGFRRFRLRGLHKVQLEWDLVCLAHNIRMLHRHKTS